MTKGSPVDLYLNLTKSCLMGKVCEEPLEGSLSTRDCISLIEQADEEFREELVKLGETIENLIRMGPEQLCLTLNKMDKRRSPHTMTDEAGIDNLRWCIEDLLARGVPGDLIETGVWKGGLTIFMRAVLKAYGDTEKKVWVADSFKGLPKPDPKQSLADAVWYFLSRPISQLEVSQAYVEDLFDRYDVLDEKVKFLEGWFEDTLYTDEINNLSLMRLDGDWYESTMCALDALYKKLSPGGYVIVDDYGVPTGCRKAVDEFRRENNINSEMTWINKQAVFWMK